MRDELLVIGVWWFLQMHQNSSMAMFCINALLLWSNGILENKSPSFFTIQVIDFLINLGALKLSHGATISFCNLMKNSYKNLIY